MNERLVPQIIEHNKKSKHQKFNFEDFCFRIKRAIDNGIDVNAIKQLAMDPFDKTYPLGRRISDIRNCRVKLSDIEKQKLKEDFGLDIEHKSKKNKFDFEDFCIRLERLKNNHKNIEDIKISDMDPYDETYPMGQKISNIRQGKIKLSDKQKQKLEKLGLRIDKDENRFDFENFCFRLGRLRRHKKDVNAIRQNDMDPYDPEYPLGLKIHTIRRGGINLTDKQKQILENKYGLRLEFKEIKNKFDFDDFYFRIKRILDNGGRIEDIKANKNYMDPYDNTYPLGSKIDMIRSGRIKLDDTQKEMLVAIGLRIERKKKSSEMEAK